MVTNSIPSSHQNKWKHTAVVRGQWQLVGQHNTTQHTTGGLAWFQNSKPFFESNLVGNGQSYPDKNTHFQSGKLVWDAAFMWRESRHSSLVLARQPSSLSISSGLLLVRLQDSNFPAAAAALASAPSLFQLGCFSLRCLWTVIVEDRPNLTVPCPKELLLF